MLTQGRDELVRTNLNGRRERRELRRALDELLRRHTLDVHDFVNGVAASIPHKESIPFVVEIR